jgi:hypothetical protein
MGAERVKSFGVKIGPFADMDAHDLETGLEKLDTKVNDFVAGIGRVISMKPLVVYGDDRVSEIIVILLYLPK